MCADRLDSKQVKVRLYDSSFTKWDEESLSPIMKQFRCAKGQIDVLKGVQKQSGNRDCGLFAIAFATSIAFGHDPLKTTYVQSATREHFADCLVRTFFTLFP